MVKELLHFFKYQKIFILKTKALFYKLVIKFRKYNFQLNIIKFSRSNKKTSCLNAQYFTCAIG